MLSEMPWETGALPLYPAPAAGLRRCALALCEVLTFVSRGLVEVLSLHALVLNVLLLALASFFRIIVHLVLKNDT